MKTYKERQMPSDGKSLFETLLKNSLKTNRQ